MLLRDYFASQAKEPQEFNHRIPRHEDERYPKIQGLKFCEGCKGEGDCLGNADCETILAARRETEEIDVIRRAECIARWAYQYADAMLDERERS